jgi:hypothetical protein
MGTVRLVVVGFGFWILGVVVGTFDGGEFEEGLALVGDEVGLGDLEGAGADFVEGEGGVGLDFVGSDEGEVVMAALLVGLGGEGLDFVLLPLLLALPRQHRRQVFLFAHIQLLHQLVSKSPTQPPHIHLSERICSWWGNYPTT